MKKSTKKVVNTLSKYIGKEIIRTKPTVNGDWSLTDEPALLLGFTTDGRMKYRYAGTYKGFGDEEKILPLSFTDGNWITYKKAQKPKNNRLNEWKGKRIRRIRPTSTIGDRSYMDNPVTLIAASKYHMMVRYKLVCSGEMTFILRPDFAKPEDWVLADDD